MIYTSAKMLHEVDVTRIQCTKCFYEFVIYVFVAGNCFDVCRTSYCPNCGVRITSSKEVDQLLEKKEVK